MKKNNNQARRAGEKNNLAPILSESPPPQYQKDRALVFYVTHFKTLLVAHLNCIIIIVSAQKNV